MQFNFRFQDCWPDCDDIICSKQYKMKEALRKLKGTSFPTELGQITLCQIFREEQCQFDQLYFHTQHENLICKIYNLAAESSQERFQHQKRVFEEGKYQQLAEYIDIEEIQIKKKSYGVLVLKIAKNSFLKEIYNSLTYNDWLNLTQTIFDFIQSLRSQAHVFLNLNPWSIAKNGQGQFKIIDAQFLTPQGSYEQLSQNNYTLIDICEKQYQYRSPQLLDQYSKCKIDHSSDLFSYAVIIAELMYRQYPFDSKLSQINCSTKMLQQNQSFFTELVLSVLKPYPKRANIEAFRVALQTERKKVPKEPNSKNMSSGSTNQSKSSNIFSGITQMISRLTTQTQSWYLNFTENDDSRPEEKYLNNLVNKLYKKETKMDKLMIIIMKYVNNSEMEVRENQILKTMLLIVSLFRRGPNIMNYQWEQIINSVQSFSKNNIILEVCNLCRQKIAINTKLKPVFRGNFYIQDLGKFKNLTVQMIETLYSHTIWLVDSLGKILFSKSQKQVYDYAKQIYCDEILDSISMLIFSIISVRKDNDLQMRKDNLAPINQIQKKLNTLLKKISNLSNHVNAHAIYSLQGEFFYYQQQIQLRQKPYLTSLQYFYRQCRQYKGLCVPVNYHLTYSSGDQKQFLSNDNNRIQKQKSISFAEKTYFQEVDSQGDRNDSFKVIDSPSPEKPKSNKKEQFLEMLSMDKSAKKDAQKQEKTLKPNIPKYVEQKKTVTFDQFFNFDAPKPKGQNQPSKTKITEQLFGKDEVTEKPHKKSDDFTFFQAFAQPTKVQPPKPSVKQAANNNFFQVFGQKQKQPKAKPGLGNSNSQKLIQQNIFNYDWLQKSSLQPIIPQKQQLNNELLNNILSGLKLKELKQMIKSNQEIIIDFDKLKLQKVIGSGSAGEVYQGQYENETLAIKKVKTKENPNALKEFQRELLTYIKIKRNPYLVSLVGLSKSQENYYLLTQFCNSGSLFDLLHKRAMITPLSWKQKIDLALQIAKGMLSLHSMKPAIIHRDLKSLNVFVIQNNGKFTAKVADFGLSRSPEAEMMTSYLGTLHWMAPELLDNKQYSVKVDVYSYAVVLWEICARKTPYNELSTPMAIIKHVTIQKKRPNMSVMPPDCPPQLIQLMIRCWSHEAVDRPQFPQIIQKLSKVNVFI